MLQILLILKILSHTQLNLRLPQHSAFVTRLEHLLQMERRIGGEYVQKTLMVQINMEIGLHHIA